MRRIIPIFITILSLLSVDTYAQRCSTTEHVQKALANDPAAAARRAAIETYTQNWISNNAQRKTTAVTYIPIVVHVLYRNTADNISEAQIQSQLTILNACFRKTNSNFSSTPAPFQNVAADVEIEFCLAQTDPNGNTTNGITRTQVPNNFDGDNDYNRPTQGGVAPWDADRYVNIYVVHLASGTLGFTYTPGTVNKNMEGIVIAPKNFGNVGTAATNHPYNGGTTLVHEMGHYFNLEHIWGVNNSGCLDDDGVLDTPPQDKETAICGNFPEHDNCSPTGNGIMYMNYMDYSIDACLTMFTNGQKQRMLAALNGPRSGLKNSSAGCWHPVGLSAIANDDVINIAPNPANNRLTITLGNTENVSITMVNSMVATVYHTTTNDKQVSINTTNLPSGMYYIKMSTTTMARTEKILIAH